MLDTILYSDTTSKLGDTTIKTLSVVDKALDTIGLTLDVVNNQLKDLSEPQDAELKALDKAISKARKTERLKKYADKVGVDYTSFIKGTESKP